MKMEEIGDQRQRRVASSNLIGRCLISFVSSSLTHLCLFMLPSFFPSFSLLSLLSLSAVALLGVTGVGRCCKRLVGVGASAPAFVFFNIIFIWGVYIGLVRQVISPLLDVVLNAEFFMLVIGLCSILTTDPGYVTNESSHNNQLVESPVSVFEAHSENSIPLQRVRYCRHCKAYVTGFDHHCPAFENCIGQKNHVLFIILLVGFVFTEASYVVCSSQFATKFQIMDNIGGLTSSSRNLAISAMLLSLLQVLWQGVFLSWHIYCVCFNIKTDEWGKPPVKVKQGLQILMTREFCGM